MRIGTSTRVVWHRPTLSAIDFIAETGFDHVELWTEYPHLCIDLTGDEEIERIRQRIESHGLGVTIHAPIRDINLSSLNYGIRRESVRQIEAATRLAPRVDASIVVIHPGRNTSKKDPAEWTEKLFHESLEVLVSVAEEETVTLAMENMEARKGEYITSAESLVNVIEKIGSSRLRATFDIAHAHTLGKDLVEFYEVLKRYVVHVHLSDNTGPGSTTHAEIGKGNIDFGKILRYMSATGYEGVLNLEGYHAHDPEAATSRNYQKLRRILDNISV